VLGALSAPFLNGERSFAWLGNFLRLLIRWEYLFSVYRSLFTVAVLLLCLRRDA
jgi:hypothetical protein